MIKERTGVIAIPQTVSYTPFIRAWRDKPKAQVVEEMASMQMESKRIPDPYSFRIGPRGILISPETGRPVRDSILVRNDIEQREFDAFRVIERICAEKANGTIIWISPPSPDYEGTKIIVSEIHSNGRDKQLFNRAILTDHNSKESIHMANHVSAASNTPDHYFHTEEVRGLPIYLDGSTKWEEVLAPFISEAIFEMIRTNEDITQKELAKKAALSLYRKVARADLNSKTLLAVQKSVRGFLGKNPLSCPPSAESALDKFVNNATVYKELDCTCPNCKKRVKAIIHSGRIHCPECEASAPYEC